MGSPANHPQPAILEKAMAIGIRNVKCALGRGCKLCNQLPSVLVTSRLRDNSQVYTMFPVGHTRNMKKLTPELIKLYEFQSLPCFFQPWHLQWQPSTPLRLHSLEVPPLPPHVLLAAALSRAPQQRRGSGGLYLAQRGSWRIAEPWGLEASPETQ